MTTRASARGNAPASPAENASGNVDPSSTPTTKRLDVQGLRAIAVVAVVANHLTGNPAGGFVGVDVFFVISGFLITGTLRHAMASHPSFGPYLGAFYWRRIKRLLPAAIVVTLLTITLAPTFFTAARASDATTDGLWSSVFLANYHFASVGTDYFAGGRAASPFQHYWSLSVEEQFYVVWPAALFAAAILGAALVRRGRSERVRNRAMLAVAVVLTAISFVIAMSQTRTDPTGAYFSTVSRAWELGLGAIIALLASSLRLPRVAAAVMSVVGLAVIVVSLFVVTNGADFPAPGAVLPCVGAAICLVANSGAGAWNPLLTNKVAVFLGDISYSVYLVHFPVIVFAGAQLGEDNRFFYWTSTVVTLGAAIVLHYGVERPVMQLRRGAGRAAPRSGAATGRSGLVGVVAGACVLFLGASIITLRPDTATANDARETAIATALKQQPAQAARPEQAELTGRIRSALRATSWPTLNPTIDDEVKRDAVAPGQVDCGQITLQPTARCTVGPADAARTMYVVGDSTSMAYVQAYKRVVEKSPGWKLRIGAAYGCGFSGVVVKNADPAIEKACGQHNDEVVQDINRTRPDLVVVTNTYTERTRADTGEAISDRTWDAALSVELAKLTSNPQIAVVEPAPSGTDPYTCYQPGSRPVDCSYELSSQHLRRAAAEKKLAASKDWRFVSTQGWFCDTATGYCPAFVGTTSIKHDTVHASYAYDDVIAPVVREAFRTLQLVTI